MASNNELFFIGKKKGVRKIIVNNVDSNKYGLMIYGKNVFDNKLVTFKVPLTSKLISNLEKVDLIGKEIIIAWELVGTEFYVNNIIGLWELVNVEKIGVGK